VGVDAVGAAVGDADRNVDHFLVQRVQGAGSHHLLHAAPSALQQIGLNRQRFPEVGDPVSLARLHDVVIHVANFGACLPVFDEFDGRHEKLPALGYSYCALVSLSMAYQGLTFSFDHVIVIPKIIDWDMLCKPLQYLQNIKLLYPKT
jgi:hypothetical protein